MSRSIGLLAALALALALALGAGPAGATAGAQEPAQTGRIWKGTLGESAITACFDEQFLSDGVY